MSSNLCELGPGEKGTSSGLELKECQAPRKGRQVQAHLVVHVVNRQAYLHKFVHDLFLREVFAALSSQKTIKITILHLHW